MVGLCNCSTLHVRRALHVLGNALVSVQNEFNLYKMQALKPCPSESGRKVAKSNKAGIIKLCTQHKLIFLPFGVLGGLGSRNGKRSLALDFPKLHRLAVSKAATVQVLVLAWMRARWPTTIVPLVGTRTIGHTPDPGAVDKLAAALSSAELQLIDEQKPLKR